MAKIVDFFKKTLSNYHLRHFLSDLFVVLLSAALTFCLDRLRSAQIGPQAVGIAGAFAYIFRNIKKPFIG